jgi:putative ABC transport system permease protein
MAALRFALRNLWRDLKSGEIAVLLLALMVAVLSLTAVGFFTNRISAGVRAQATEVLAADLRVESAQPLQRSYAAEASRRGLRTADVVQLATAIFHGEASQLTSLIAVSSAYPLRGTVRIADRPFGAARPTHEVPAPGEAWVDARLIAQLDVAVGATVQVGAAQFRIARILDYRPDQGSGFVNLAPAVLVNIADLGATQLIQPGSRATYAGLFAGTADAVAAFREWLGRSKKPGERIEDLDESSRQLNSAIERSTRFLNLASLAAVLLAAVAVAMGARRYVARHLDAAALMKCMGASQRFILSVSVLELAMVGAAAVLLGAALGAVAQSGLAWLLRDLIRGELPPATWQPVLMAGVTVLAMLVGFALPPLLSLKNTPPARVLRRNIEAPALRYGSSYVIALAALLAIVWVLVRDTELVFGLFAGVLGAGIVLAAAGFGLVRLTRRLRGGVGISWRYGLANVSRRGGESVVQIVAFGLGLMVLLLLAVVRNDLLKDWQKSLPADVPNNFMINIRPDERQPLLDYLASHGLGRPSLFPMVRARIATINGAPAEQQPNLDDRGKAFVEREQNLTWSQSLPADNQIIAGRWWSAADDARPRVSISTEYQEALHLQVGDRIGFDVAGEPVEATVASIRKVRWDSFRPNFFLVFPPGQLDGAAGTYMTSVYLNARQRPALVGLVRQFPSVSVFDVDAILTQIRSVIDRASLAVQYVFLFTLAAGVVVLLAAVQSTRDERRYESAMLRTLGASRRTVLQGVAAEFSALGFLSGVLAASGASVIGWLLARRLFSVDYGFDPWLWGIGLVCGTVLVGVSGALATRRVVNTPPIVTLRQ